MKKIISVFMLLLVMTIALNSFAAEIKMTDVDYNTDLGKSIDKLVKGGVVNGIPQDDGTYKYAPNNPVTRAEFCKMVNTTFGYEIMANNIFTDVSSDKWYYVYVLQAIHYKYIQGYGNGKFGGEDYITREQVCVILSTILAKNEAEKKTETTATASAEGEAKPAPAEIKIADKVSAWAKTYVEDIISKGYIPLEEGNKFRATENMTRGELALALDDFVVEKTDTPTQVTPSQNEGTGVDVGIKPSSGNMSSGSSSSGSSSSGNSSSGNTTPEPEPEPEPEVEYTITYELNGLGELPEDAATSYFSSKGCKLPVLANTTMNLFAGWYTDSGLADEAKVTSIVKGTTGDLTLYAKWVDRYTEEELLVSEDIYNSLEFAVYDMQEKDELEVFSFDEKGQIIYNHLKTCANEVYAMRETGLIVSNSYVRNTYNEQIQEIVDILDGMSPEERDAFEFEVNKLNTVVLKDLVDLFDVNINYGK